MKLPIVAVLLVSAALLSGTEAGWVRKTLSKAGDAAKKFIKQNAVQGVTEIVRRYGPALATRALGKRSVRDLSPKDDGVARALLDELELACPRLFGSKDQGGLTATIVQAAFGQSDGNNDGNLNNEELDLFENVVDAVRHCLDVLKNRGAQGGEIAA